MTYKEYSIPIHYFREDSPKDYLNKVILIIDNGTYTVRYYYLDHVLKYYTMYKCGSKSWGRVAIIQNLDDIRSTSLSLGHKVLEGLELGKFLMMEELLK